jgi:hypothetical protein
MNYFRRVASKTKQTLLSFIRHSPDFLIIGTQKSGTTSLYEYLKMHSRIIGPEDQKELHFFNLYYHRGLTWYLSHFPLRIKTFKKLAFEATPDYIRHEKAPSRIIDDLGKVKLILTLRDPVERAFSAWKMWHSFKDDPEKAKRADYRTFSEAIHQELLSPDNQQDLHFHYLQKGRYIEQIENYYKYFSKDDILILDYQDMNDDLINYLNQICQFLKIAPFPKEKSNSFTKNRHWVGPSWKVTADDKTTMKHLRDYYAPYNKRLFDLLGRRFDWD